MWACPKCKREFGKTNQSHSCIVYPLASHFKDKPYGKKLFESLIERLRSKGLVFRIDSVTCCIHLVNVSTFLAVWVGKSKISIDFRLDYELRSKRFSKSVKISANRYIYYLDVMNDKEIDKELIDWCIESYGLS